MIVQQKCGLVVVIYRSLIKSAAALRGEAAISGAVLLISVSSCWQCKHNLVHGIYWVESCQAIHPLSLFTGSEREFAYIGYCFFVLPRSSSSRVRLPQIGVLCKRGGEISPTGMYVYFDSAFFATGHSAFHMLNSGNFFRPLQSAP